MQDQCIQNYQEQKNVSAGSSSTTLNGYYNLSSYKVSCASCPTYTSKSGTESVSAGSSSTTLNGYYNLSSYKVSCASCPTCETCPTISSLTIKGVLYSNPYRSYMNVPCLPWSSATVTYTYQFDAGGSGSVVTYPSIDGTTVKKSGTKTISCTDKNSFKIDGGYTKDSWTSYIKLGVTVELTP